MLCVPTSDRIRAITLRAVRYPYILPFGRLKVEANGNFMKTANTAAWRSPIALKKVTFPTSLKRGIISLAARTTAHKLEKMTVQDKTIAINTTMMLIAVGDFYLSRWFGGNLIGSYASSDLTITISILTFTNQCSSLLIMALSKIPYGFRKSTSHLPRRWIGTFLLL